MRITELRVRNFRSIKDVSLQCRNLVTLLGPNNHGKSNLLNALDFALTTSRKPSEDDFFISEKSREGELWVEMLFCDLTKQELTTFKRYLLSDGTIRIRKAARFENNGIEISYNGWTEEPEEDWLRGENAGNFANRENINSTPLKDLVPSSGRVTKAIVEEAQQKFIERNSDQLRFSKSLESKSLLGTKNVGGGVLPEFFLIPAVRDLTDEIKIRATTTFGRLMNRAIKEMAERDPRFGEAKAQLDTVIGTLNERRGEEEFNELAMLEKSIEKELIGWGVTVNIEVTSPDIEKIFELGTSIHVDDGVRTKADRKGHGLQRAMIFALLRSWANALSQQQKQLSEGDIRPRSQSESVIFAMEEPELFYILMLNEGCPDHCVKLPKLQNIKFFYVRIQPTSSTCLGTRKLRS